MSLDVKIAAFGCVIWLAMYLADRFRPLSAGSMAFWAVVFAVDAVWSMVLTGPVSAAVVAGMSAWHAYLAWKRRKPRQRKPSKVAAVIRKVGHRLAVVPT